MFTKLSQLISRQNNAVLAAVALVFSGLGFLSYGVSTQVVPPMPANSVSAAVEKSPLHFTGKSLPVSEPVSVEISSIGVKSELIQVGKNQDGSIEVPQGNDYDKAAWYKYSATPGQIGPAVIEGHIDSAENGPSVFFNLGKLKPEDKVMIERKDGVTAIFEINSVAVYGKDEFPTEKVYGLTKHAALRLITCGGNLNRSSGEYDSNIIAFGSLVDTSNK